jgi:hypothetical protein
VCGKSSGDIGISQVVVALRETNRERAEIRQESKPVVDEAEK